MTKVYEFGDISISVLKAGSNDLLILCTDGMDKYEFEVTYPSEYLRNFAYDNATEDMCAYLANGCSKIFVFKRQMEIK